MELNFETTLIFNVRMCDCRFLWQVTLFRGPWNALATFGAHSCWSTPPRHPPPPQSSSLAMGLCQCHVSFVSVAQCLISFDTIFACTGKTQAQSMTDTCSLMNVVHTYTMSWELTKLCIRFVGPYLQNYRWNTMNYIHIPFGGVSSLNDAMPCMGSNWGWETTIGCSNLSPPPKLSYVQLLLCLLTKTLNQSIG